MVLKFKYFMFEFNVSHMLKNIKGGQNGLR